VAVVKAWERHGVKGAGRGETGLCQDIIVSFDEGMGICSGKSARGQGEQGWEGRRSRLGLGGGRGSCWSSRPVAGWGLGRGRTRTTAAESAGSGRADICKPGRWRASRRTPKPCGSGQDRRRGVLPPSRI
jgi:hypothetical protein